MVYRTAMWVKCENMFTRGPRCSLCRTRPVRNKLAVADGFSRAVAYLCQFCNYKYEPMTVPIYIPQKQWKKFVVETLRKRI